MNQKRNIQSSNKLKFHVIQDERFVDMNLFQVGWEKCKPLHQFGPAIRNHFLFHYVISGKGRLHTNDIYYPIHAGQGFLLCPGQSSTYFADEQDPWTYVWIEFDGLRARESVTLAGLSENQPVYTPDRKENGSHIENLLMHIVDHPEYSPTRLIGHALIFLDELIQTSKTKIANTGTKKLRDFYIKEAIAYIDANYQYDISIQDISDACGLNRSYFGRLFKETMSLSPQQFLIQYRMTKAAQLLKGSRIPVAEVGIAVGYENQLHFSRAFKSVFDISPSEYRKKHYIDIE